MNIKLFFKLFCLCYPVFVLMDIVWIGVIMKPLYQKKLGHIVNLTTFSIPAALCVWAFIVAGAIIFVLPKICLGPFKYVLWWGSCYGLIVYGVYDLTNYALLKHWPLSIAILDILWGMMSNAFLATIIYILYLFLKK